LKISNESFVSLGKSELTSKLPTKENAITKIMNEEHEKIEASNEHQIVHDFNESKPTIHSASTIQPRQTVYSQITEKEKYEEKVALSSKKTNASSYEQKPIQIFSKPERKFAQIIPSNLGQGAKRSIDTDFNSLKHLRKTDDTIPTADRSKTLDRSRPDRGQVDSKSAPRSSLKETTRTSHVEKTEPIVSEKPKTNQQPQTTEEVSLEELIKKYNGPRSSDKYNVTPIRPPPAQKQKELVDEDSNKPLRMRSSSCHRPNEMADNSQRRDSGATDVTSHPVSTGSGTGKFSSMKELLKNVVSSQKNVQQQKMEFGQKSSGRKQQPGKVFNITKIIDQHLNFGQQTNSLCPH
jgi:hypothetical protein